MRERELFDSLPLIAVSIAAHLLLFYAVGLIPVPERKPRDLIEIEIAQELPEPKPKPKPEPKPEPEPPRKVRPKPRPKKEPPPPPSKPPPPAPAPKFRLPPSQLVAPGEGSGVDVDEGEASEQGYDTRGRDDGRQGGKRGGAGKGPPTDAPTDTNGKSGTPWKPTSELYVQTLPRPSKKPPKLQCPATRDGIAGIVVLRVQIRRTGDIRRVRVDKGIGHGCDEIAVKALKKSTWKAAVATDGKPADYELRYEYEFRAAD